MKKIENFDKQGAIYGAVTAIGIILSIVLAIFIPDILEGMDIYISDFQATALQFSVGSVLVIIISVESIVRSAKKEILDKLK